MKNKSIHNNIYYENDKKNRLNNKEDRLKNQGDKLEYQRDSMKAIIVSQSIKIIVMKEKQNIKKSIIKKKNK